MAKRRITPYRPIYPSPAALITSVDLNGTANIITLGEVFKFKCSSSKRWNNKEYLHVFVPLWLNNYKN